MFKRIGKYISKKVTQSVVGKVVKWGFWSLVFMFPGTLVTTVGVSGIVVAAATVHSGVIEYGASSLIAKGIDKASGPETL